MKKYFSLFSACFLATHILFAQTKKQLTIYFEPGITTLNPDSRDRIKKSIEQIKNKDMVRIKINGHSDSDGSEYTNLELSEKRANSTSTYFSSLHIGTNKIETAYFGERNPIATNDDLAGKKQNRRVDIVIEEKETTFADIFAKSGKEAQKFRISSNEDMTIKGKEGTILTIQKNSLVGKNGARIDGMINVELREFYKKSDFVLADLHTMSGNKLLESAGMIYVSAKYGSDTLQLSDGKELSIRFPADKDMDGMKLFNGRKKGLSIDWVLREGSEVEKKNVTPEKESLVPIRDTTHWRKLSQIDNRAFSSGRLGWINCDRFSYTRNTTQLVVPIDTGITTFVRLVFRDINAIMPAYYASANQMVLNGVPVGRKATLLAFALQGDEPYYYSKDIVIGESQVEHLDLKKTSMAELEKFLQGLD